MTKEELECNLKNYKKNIGTVKIKELILRKLNQQIKAEEKNTAETNLTSSMGVNYDIRSKYNVISKIENAIINKNEEIEKMRIEISNIKKEICELNNCIEDTRIRFETLSYKKRKIIEAYFFEEKSYEEIGNNLYFKLFKQTRDKKTIKNIIDSTIVEMAKI